MTEPTRTDLVVQGASLASCCLPSEVMGIALRIDPVASGVMRLRDVDPERARAALPALSAAGLDAALVPQGMLLTHFRLLASDLDSTLVAAETLDTVARDAGYGESVAQVTEAAMRGEITDYAESLRRRIRVIRGCPRQRFLDYAARLPYMPGAKTLARAAKAAGLSFWIVTGGFEELAQAAASELGADGFYCNRIAHREGLLTGEVSGPEALGGRIIDADGKRELVARLSERMRIPASEVIALGDGWNDVKMLGFAGLGVAYHAKPRVRERIPMQVNALGLDSILYWFEDGARWRAAAGA